MAEDIHDDSNDDTQQLEAENRENENEANTKEEADKTRMHDDNVRNTERELYDGAAQPRAEENIDITLCVICLDRERNAAVFPCGHTHLCLTCVKRLREENGLCPMCQRHIQEYREVFV
ncbi:probable E3 ubiquitin-protein ligase LUL4 [Haliotis rubra]|uniref:probable E3 ubiquitin-protein ligase LUL4 n=1 Tax=Haliotis rubra TaxID=36100 RepID=UPI001EE5FE09|nr:probable E3 ubiquitin-protein ligase LUL4 [Haliotis rubra]